MKGTRLERSLSNKRAHAIRRELTAYDFQAGKRNGIPWGDHWSRYEAMSNLQVFGLIPAVLPAPSVTPDIPVTPSVVPVVTLTGRKRRTLPDWLKAPHAEYLLMRESWESGLESAMAGGSRDGKPARGEKYTDEERDYRAEFPRPLWTQFVSEAASARRALGDGGRNSGFPADSLAAQKFAVRCS